MTHIIYAVVDPNDPRFASAGRRGTWFPRPGPGPCPECTGSRQKRVSPLIIEWNPGSERFGDFIWPGFNDEIVVTQRVREALEENRFRGIEFHPVEMIQQPKLKRPQKATKRTKPRVWLPYEGPPLWDLQPTSWCHVDLERTDIRLEKVCSCGAHYYFRPLEGKEYIFLDPSTWDGAEIFHLYEYGWIYCTEKFVEFIESRGFTNVHFVCRGELPDK